MCCRNMFFPGSQSPQAEHSLCPCLSPGFVNLLTRFHSFWIIILNYPALLIYDIICTLDEEIDVIWNRKFSLPTFLFFSIRIGTIGIVFFEISAAFFGPVTVKVGPFNDSLTQVLIRGSPRCMQSLVINLSVTDHVH